MKVLIADDHAIVREGLKNILLKQDGISQIVETSNGQETLEKIKKDQYDLLILDISLPDINGIDILKRIKDQGIKIRILVLSVHPQSQYALRAFKLGASGYICKDSVSEELAIAIKKISSGGKYISSALAEKIVFGSEENLDILPHENLSEREFQVMIKLAQGKSVLEISKELFLSDRTVSTYRTRIFNKMNLSRNAELSLYAIRNNLIE